METSQNLKLSVPVLIFISFMVKKYGDNMRSTSVLNIFMISISKFTFNDRAQKWRWNEKYCQAHKNIFFHFVPHLCHIGKSTDLKIEKR